MNGTQLLLTIILPVAIFVFASVALMINESKRKLEDMLIIKRIKREDMGNYIRGGYWEAKHVFKIEKDSEGNDKVFHTNVWTAKTKREVLKLAYESLKKDGLI
jgi:hypothetical protein